MVVKVPAPVRVALARSMARLKVSAPLPPRVPPVIWKPGVVASKVKAVSRLSVPLATRRVPVPLMSEKLLVPPLTMRVAPLAMSTTPGVLPLPLSRESEPALTLSEPVLPKARLPSKFWVAALVLVMVPVLARVPIKPPL